MSNVFHTEKPEIKPGGELPDGRTSFDYVYYPETDKTYKRTLQTFDAGLHPDKEYPSIVVDSQEIDPKDLSEDVRAKLLALIQSRAEQKTATQIQDPPDQVRGQNEKN